MPQGGVIQGPGTGTSDSIRKDVPAGSYIMPADSVDAIGPSAVAGMGKISLPRARGGLGFKPQGSMPVRVSNGEYEMPPEQVHAVGAAVLDNIKDATHQPKAAGFLPASARPRTATDAGPGLGFKPKSQRGNELFFANGGLVDEEKKRPNSFGDAQAAANNPGMTQINPAGKPVATPTAQAAMSYGPGAATPGLNREAAPNPTPGASSVASTPTSASPPKTGGFGNIAQAAYGVANPVGAAASDPNMQRITAGAVKTAVGAAALPFAAIGDAARRGAANLVGGDPNTLSGGASKYADAASGLIDDSTSQIDRGVAGLQEYGRNMLGVQKAAPAGVAASVATPVSAKPATAPATNSPTTTTSDTASPAAAWSLPDAVARAKAGNGYLQTGIDGVVGKKDASGHFAFTNDPAAVAGAGVGKNNGLGFQGAGAEDTGRTGSGFSVMGGGQEAMDRNDRALAIMRSSSPGRGFSPGSIVIGEPQGSDARTAALEAASTPYKGSPHGQLTANQLRTIAGISENDDRTALAREGNATNLAREQIQQEGANQRADQQEAGQNARFGASNVLAQQELGLRQEAQGFQSSAARRQEALYQKYESAKTPEERTAIAQQIRDLKGDTDRYTVVPGGQEIDPISNQLVTRPAQVFNNQTGQFIQMQQQSVPTPRKDYDALPKGSAYIGPDGRRYIKS